MISTYARRMCYVLSALNERGELVTLVKTAKASIPKGNNYYCPVCQERVMLKTGSNRIWHFAHYHHASCGTSEAESDYHLKGKELLYEWFVSQNMQVDIETYFPNIKQRADLYVKSPFQIPIEFQCATIDSALFTKRTNQYMNINQKPLWILGGNRLRRIGTQLFRLHQMDWHALQETNHSSHRPFLLYFCPDSNKFALITNITPYSTTKAIGHIQYFSRNQLSFHSLYEGNIKFHHNQLNDKEWLQVKEQWRVFRYRQQTPAFQYVNAMFQSQTSDVTLFPGEAGLPTHYSYWIETAPHLWQSWLLIQCVMSRSEGSTFQFRDVYDRFKQLVSRGIFKIRKLPLVKQSHYSFALMNYLLLLCDLGLLSRVGKSKFLKKKEIVLPYTLEQALQMDEQVQTILNQKR